VKFANTWNQNLVAATQTDHTHLGFNETMFQRMTEKKQLCRKYSFCMLFSNLKECLNMKQVKLLAHLNGEYYNTCSACHDLKRHILEFTKEQLSCDILFQ
jgi:hypothetical protein